MVNLPEQFLKRMQERLGEGYPAFLQCYENPPYKGLRVNPLKISVEAFLERAPFPLGEQIDWEWHGFYHTEEKAGADVYHFAGLYYLQEPSAMCIADAVDACKKERVLDLCAAPGGKTTLIASYMEGDGILVSNEIDSGRAKILSQNVERMGITNCAVTNASPQQLAEKFPEYFDMILVDAPCSGEGMFKKEQNAIPEWSEENVARCVARQKEILEEAAKMLAGGGHLIYSTCTFSEEEDEWQIEDFLKRHPEFELLEQHKLYPHEKKGEGHFCARMYKRGSHHMGGSSAEGGEGGAPIRHGYAAPPSPRRVEGFPVKRNSAAEKAYRAFSVDFFENIPEGEITTLADGRMYLVPAGMPALDVRLLRLGVELGEWDGKLFKPAHALAMALGTHAKRKVKLTREEAKKYLRGETLEAEIENGWCVVCVEEFPLGLGKAVNGTVKNHLPKGLRLRG